MRLATRMSRLGTETAFEVLARARKLEASGRSIVHLEIGEPDFDTPANIIDAGVAALRGGYTHYGPSAGLPEVREAIAAHVTSSRHVQVSADQVLVTPGGKPVLFFAALALLDPGDEVIFPDPGFPIYESVVNFTSAKPVPLELREEDAFGLDLDRLESLLTPRTRMLILNSPHNPTGGVITKGQVDALAKLLERYPDTWVLSDEIYSAISYDAEPASLLSCPGLAERTILLDGFSKTFAMTGWRLGYGVMPAALATTMARIQTNVTSCTATFVQRAALEALGGPQDAVQDMVRRFRRRRDVIVERLNAMPGVRCLAPGGAFYAYPNIEGTGMTGAVLAQRLLDEAGVACLAGTAFGRSGGSFIRFSYANSLDNIEEAMRRMSGFLAGAGT